MHGPNIQLLDPRATILKIREPQPRRNAVRTAEQKRVSLASSAFRAGEEFVTPRGNRSTAYLAAKRLLDICGSLALIVVLSFLLITTFIVLAISTKGRPLFFQERIGFCGRRFWMLKFRTMRLDADKMQHVVQNEKDGPIFKNRRDPRVTHIGRFLRSSSIDEMPQLFNVLWGSMSLVGPRPPVAKEVVLYSPWQRRRLAVQPGLTCLWQISGRSEIEFERWVRMDLWYLQNQGFWTDLKLLAKTPASVLSGRGAYEDDSLHDAEFYFLLETILDEPTGNATASASDLAPVTARPKRTARVLHVINGEHFSGAERVQDLLALNLPTFGYEVGFACLKPGRFASLRQSQDAAIVELGMKSRFDLRPSARLARLVREEGYELIHTHTPRAALVGRLAASLAKVPLVHHVHSPTAKDSIRTIQNLLNTWTERFSLTGVSGVVAVSSSLADYAEAQGISRSRISVVQNGVPSRGPLAFREPPQGTWTLGAVALFRQRKGLEVLLDALVRLRSQGVDARLRAVGEFETIEYERKIKQRVEQLNLGQHVDWVGFTDNVPAELAKMDLFVLPSLFGEGLPMVILEAMAAGVPVVATRVEGVPEAIRDEIDGLISRPNDAINLADTIARVIYSDTDWSRLRTNAHQHHAECFSDCSMAQGVVRVYGRVLQCS